MGIDWTTPEAIGHAQVVVYVMTGGGMLGKMAAEQPADFYIDARVGRLPYGRREIMKAVGTLKQLVVRAGLDPRALPRMPYLHNLGVF